MPSTPPRPSPLYFLRSSLVRYDQKMPQIPQVTIPDVHGLSEKEAQDALSKVGLQARKVDQCNGSDQGNPKAKKHSIQCQNPAANVAVPLGTTVEYRIH